MNPRHHALRALLHAAGIALLLLTASPAAHAQCDGWLAGPLDHGTAVNGTDGVIHAMTVWDPDGGGPLNPRTVVGGSFTTFQGEDIQNLAMQDPSTGMWGPVGGSPSATVLALATWNDLLVVGFVGDNNVGTFDETVRTWNGSSWGCLGVTNTGDIRALAVHNGDLYVGGDFVSQFTTSTQPANGVARWNPGANLWDAMNTGVTGTVYAMVSWNGELVVGGDFGIAGGLTHNRIARWTGVDWTAMSTGMDGPVYTMASFLGQLYVGGAFTTAGGAATGHLARWSGAAWSSAGGNFGGTYVGALTVHNGKLAIGGSFPAVTPNIAFYDGGAYSYPGTGGTNGAVTELLSSNGRLLASGYGVTTFGTVPANGIAQWDGVLWLPLKGGLAAQVRAMTTYNGRLVAGGDFHQAADPVAPVHHVAGWNGTGLTGFGAGMNNQVFALKAFKYLGAGGDWELIAAGNFTQAGGVSANRVARWREDPLSPLPPPAWEAMGNGFNSIAYAVERFSGSTYAGGVFTADAPGGTTLSRIARWDENADTWLAVGTGMNGVVYALKDYNGYLYAGGSFTTAGGVSTGGLARWNGSSWSQVGGFFLGTVYALEVHNGALVMAGDFAGFGGSPDISSWNGSFYANFGTGGSNGQIYALHSSGGRLYAGGNFSTCGGASAARMASWDGATWQQVGGGADDVVYAIGSYGGEVHAGGWFGFVEPGSIVSARWARHSSGAPWLTRNPSSQTVNPGADVSLTVQAAAGYSGLAYQWYRYGTPLANGPTASGSSLAGAQSATLTLTGVTIQDAGSYWAEVVNACGADSSASATLNVNGATDAPDVAAAGWTGIRTVAPNPTSGGSRVAFALEREANVRMRVFDVAGRLVRETDLGRLAAGAHESVWDGRVRDGRPVQAGVVFVTLEVDGRRLPPRRLVIVR
jgi:hypothetical protein